MGVTVKGQHRDCCGEGNILHLDCTSISTIVVMYVVLQDVTVGGHWVKGTGISVFVISCNYM